MPPPNAGDKLNPEQINTIKQWISEGGKIETLVLPKTKTARGSKFKFQSFNQKSN